MKKSVGPQEAAMDSFYRGLIPPNSLCFDVGANVGLRVASFRRLGMPVVALEPQPDSFSVLSASFGQDPDVTLVNKAAGRSAGTATMMVSDVHGPLSTLSQEFIDATTRSKRFAYVTWDRAINVEIVTLDSLIERYGVPDFIKIDVEGFEAEVIGGLSRPIDLIALEWTPELTDNLIDCVSQLDRLGPVEFNLSWGESMRLARPLWMDKELLIYTLDQFREETYLFGDVYVRSVKALRGDA